MSGLFRHWQMGPGCEAGLRGPTQEAGAWCDLDDGWSAAWGSRSVRFLGLWAEEATGEVAAKPFLRVVLLDEFPEAQEIIAKEPGQVVMRPGAAPFAQVGSGICGSDDLFGRSEEFGESRGLVADKVDMCLDLLA